MKRLFLALGITGLLLSVTVNEASGSQLIDPGSVWKYNDNGVDLVTTWPENSYDDAGWASGPAQLGFGEKNGATTISFGDKKNKYPCYYFRYSFDVADPNVYGALTLKVLRDDGCVVYLNGREVARSNMPSGTITYNTGASSGIEGDFEDVWHEFSADPALLIDGTNLIAVEVHIDKPNSRDLSFNLELTGVENEPLVITSHPSNQTVNEGQTATFTVVAGGSEPLSYQWRKDYVDISGATFSSYTTPPTTVGDDRAKFDVIVTNLLGSEISNAATLTVTVVTDVNIVKGPYLQMVTPNSMVIMWETDVDAGSRVVYGQAAPDEYSVENTDPVTIHEITLIDNLTADTKYYYKVTSDDVTSATYTFSTAPATARPFRFVAYGDTRTGYTDHTAVIQAIIGNDPKPEFVLNSGDLVNNGMVENEWEPQFFEPAHDLMVNTPMLPILGNHEYWGSGQIWFFDFFSLPNNEEWFAFSYGNARFIGLNTNVDYSPLSDQYDWLLNEFVSPEYTNATWHFVYFHHPPYTATSNHSDEIDVQTYLVPKFELYGVDMVFNGHSHAYERYHHNGIYYIVTGGGGAPLANLVTDTEEPIRQVGAKEYHYCIIDVNESYCDFIVKKIDGSVIDQVQLTLVDDVEPPVITGATGDVPDAATGDPVTISATITDNISVTSVKVYYTPIGGAETNISMTKAPDSDIWTGEVPVDLNNTGTIPYYVSAADFADNTARDPASGYYSITISDNDPPVSDAGQDQSVLIGQLVYVDGSASSDNIGVTSYSWDFDASDGIGVDATGVTAEHTYSTTGPLTVTLTVTDDADLTAQDNAIVTVSEAAAYMYVDAIVVTKVDLAKGFKKGRAEVVILDESGVAVSSASVTGTFSGDIDETVTATTNSSGLAVLETTTTKKGGLNIDFCVDGVIHATLTYDAGTNVETCDSI